MHRPDLLEELDEKMDTMRIIGAFFSNISSIR